MASEIDRVLERATAPLGGSTAVQRVAEQLRRLQEQFWRLQTVQEAVVESVRNASRILPVSRQSSSRSSASGSGGGANPVEGFFGPGLLLSPLISGVLKLFGGGGEPSEPSPLVKFTLPPQVNVNAGVSRAVPGGAFGVDSAQGGLPRPVAQSVSQSVAPQITVQVQAMDSQSFLDRSGDIARAVRQAMLESSVLNDVVREA